MGQIVLKSVTTDLNPESLERAIKEIDDFKNKLCDAMIFLIARLAEEGATVAKVMLLAFDPPAYYTGQLHDSIRSDTDTKNRTGRVYVEEGTHYAFFVEYGTGIFNANSKRNGEPWIYFNDRDGKFHITYGMPPRPFMHNTLIVLTDKAKTEGGRVIAEYIMQGG